MICSGTSQARAEWSRREIAACVGLVGLGCIATWPALDDMIRIATRSKVQSHILLVPFVIAWLVWVRRGRLRRCPRERFWIGPLLVLLGWFFFSFGDRQLLEALWHLGAIVVVVGCLLSFAGMRCLFKFLPAFVALAFLVPIPGVVRQAVALPLESATLEATQRVLEVLGVGVTRTATVLSIDGVAVPIVDAYSGLRMVSALFLVSYAFAYSLPLRQPVRLLIVLLSPLSAILCNVLRLVPAALLYAHVSPRAGLLAHALGGWVMLPVAFLFLLGLIRVLRWASVPVYRYTLAYGK